MEAIRFIVDMLLWLLLLAFVLRFLFQLVRADFRDPMADAIVRITLKELVEMVLKIYLFAMLLYWIATLVPPGGYAPGIRLLAQLCEPILRRVRRVIPPIGQIDFSFLWVSIAIGA